MKKKILIVLLGIVLPYTISYSQSAKKEGNSENPDNPDARARFEWMRLRDPATGQIPTTIREKELKFASTLPTKESLSIVPFQKRQSIGLIQALTWSPRGPYNVGGRTRALGIDITNANILLAGGVSGGMWRTINGGNSWTKVTDISNLQSVTCIAQDTRAGKTSTWYYGTGEFEGNSASESGASYRGDGIFRSTDNGISWIQLPSTVSGTPQAFDQPFDYIWNVATDPSNTSQDEVYAATYGGIQRSTDGGASWTTVKGGYSNSVSMYTDIAVASTGIVYASLSQSTLSGGSSATKGIYRSVDGVTWTNITPAGWATSYNRIVIGIAPSNENVVYFLAETPGGGTLGHSFWKYTYVSGDGSGSGGTWNNRSGNIPAFGGYVGNFDSQGSYDLVIKVKPDDPNAVFIGGTNLYRSTDGFASTANTKWIGGYSTANDVSMYPNHHPDQHAIVFSQTSSSIMFTGDDGGVQKTTNDLAATVVWTPLNNGYTTSQFYTVAIDHATGGNPIVIGGLQDNGTWFTGTTNSNTPWVDIDVGDGSFCAVANGRTYYYTSSQYAWISRNVIDNNGNITEWTRVDPTGGSGYLFVNPFILDPNDSRIMYLAGGSIIWRNSDLTGIVYNPLTQNNTKSTNWSQLSNTSVSPDYISALGMSTTPANRLYYGTSNGRVYRLGGANVGDPIPSDVTGASFPANAYVSCIAVDPSNADKAVTVFSNYSVISLFYTTDGGTSWTAVAGNLEQNPNGSGNGPSCRWISILPNGGYFVGTSTGVYSTALLNGSSTVWVQEGSVNIGNVVADMIDVRSSDGLIAVGTHGNGVYTANFTFAPPTAPVLISPNDVAINQPTTLSLYWNPSPGALSYKLQVSTDSLFSTFIVNDSTILSTSSQVGPLANNTTYYWRVSAKNIGGNSAFSARRSFTTIIAAPLPPSLLSPTDNAANQNTNPTLLWNHSSNASSYRLQVSTDTIFANLIINDSTITDTVKPVVGLLFNTSYFWRINAKNIGGVSPYSSRWKFITILSTPELALPLNGVNDQQPTLTFRWHQTAGAISYQLQISVDSLFLSPVVDDSVYADTMRLVGTLATNTTYYWRLRGKNSNGKSEWSEVRHFATISNPPSIPLLLTPLNDAIDQALTLSLKWSSSNRVSTYHLQMSKDSNFVTTVISDSTLIDTFRIVGPLSNKITYYWRVRAINAVGQSTWSALWHFTTNNLVTVSYQVSDKWNMISVPLNVQDYRKAILYPTSSSLAFSYQGSYVVQDTLQNSFGYWLKFNGAQSIAMSGVPRDVDSIGVELGWNMIGSVTSPVPVSSIIEIPSGITVSNYYDYSGSYFPADTIRPAKGYWIKIGHAGKLVLQASGAVHAIKSTRLEDFNQIIFEDAVGNCQYLYYGLTNSKVSAKRFELPPVAPDGVFDVRFESERMLETVEPSTKQEFPIHISLAVYPVTIRWKLHGDKLFSSLIIGSDELPMVAEGSVKIDNPAKQYVLKFDKTPTAPSQYVLEQNYPNPFNPSTVIRYSIPKLAYVSLKVYNIIGEEVETLVYGFKQSGRYQVEFLSKNLPSGLYFYRLQSEDISLTKKFVLVK